MHYNPSVLEGLNYFQHNMKYLNKVWLICSLQLSIASAFLFIYIVKLTRPTIKLHELEWYIYNSHT